MESRLETKQDREHSELLSKAAEHQTALDNVKDRIVIIEDGMDHEAKASKDGIDSLSSDVHATRAAVMSLRDIGQQAVSFVSTFPSEMRGLLHKILQSNWQIYQMLLTIQKSPGQAPTGLLDSNIKFEDAMGELNELPYEYFRYWEV